MQGLFQLALVSHEKAERVALRPGSRQDLGPVRDLFAQPQGDNQPAAEVLVQKGARATIRWLFRLFRPLSEPLRRQKRKELSQAVALNESPRRATESDSGRQWPRRPWP